ncbi:MAG: alcohol dehydrogenase catalytic domain-containing protein [Pseudomonadota bacterium]
MKALVYDGPQEMSYRDTAMARARAGEALVEIEAVGICGSDMHAFLGHDARRPAPLILGHEAAGTVRGGALDGRRVTINPLVTCQSCVACGEGRENLCPDRQIISMPPREGAFAQYVAIPRQNLVDVPDHVSLSKAALAEPLAVGWHAARLATSVLHGSSQKPALVIGGGAIGLASALCLDAMGFADVTICEPNPERADFLKTTCSARVITVAEGAFDLIIDAVGLSMTRQTASNYVRPGGVIAHIGLAEDSGGLDIRRMTLQEVTFIGTYTYTRDDFRDTAHAIFEGRLGPLNWCEHRSLSEGPVAFKELQAGRVAAPKIMLHP